MNLHVISGYLFFRFLTELIQTITYVFVQLITVKKNRENSAFLIFREIPKLNCGKSTIKLWKIIARKLTRFADLHPMV